MLNTEKLVDGFEAYEYLRRNNDYITVSDHRDHNPGTTMADIMSAYNESKEVNNFD